MNVHKITDEWYESGRIKCICACGALLEDSAQDFEKHLKEFCNHKKTICPNHEGAFDCNPFCAKCEGEQEYCFPCERKAQLDEAVKLVTEHLTEINAHTLVRMIDFQFYGCEDETKYQVMSNTYEVAKNFLYSGNEEILGRK
jgi:hypothetical protein